MGKFAMGFMTGLLQGGLKGYQLSRAWEQADAEEARTAEKHTLEVGKLRREAERDEAVGKGTQELMHMLNTGSVHNNVTGASDTEMGPPKTLAPDAPPITQPLTRDVTPYDINKTSAAIAAAKGDVNTAAAYGKQALYDKYDGGDMKYGMEVAQNPNGPEAQKLLGFLGKQSIRGVQFHTNPETGMSSLAMDMPGGEPRQIELSGTNLINLARAYKQWERGEVRALETLSAIDKDLASAAVADWKTKEAMARLNNDAAYKGHAMGAQAFNNVMAANRDAREERKFQLDFSQMQHKRADEIAQREASAELAKSRGMGAQYVAAVRAGAIRPAEGTDSKSALGKKADEILASGLAKTREEAMRMAMQNQTDSPEQFRNTVYLKALPVTYGNHEKAMAIVEQAMRAHYPGQAALMDALPGAGGHPRAGISAQAIAHLRANPNLAAQFDQHYGAGSAAAVLGRKE